MRAQTHLGVEFRSSGCAAAAVVDDGVGFSRLALEFIALQQFLPRTPQPARISLFRRIYVTRSEDLAVRGRLSTFFFLSLGGFLFFQRLCERTTRVVSMGKGGKEKKRKKIGILKNTRLRRQCISAETVMSTPIAPLDRRKRSAKQPEEEEKKKRNSHTVALGLAARHEAAWAASIHTRKERRKEEEHHH